MGQIVCCWELGGGYGHIYRLLPIAKQFSLHGLQVVLVCKDSERARPDFENSKINANCRLAFESDNQRDGSG